MKDFTRFFSALFFVSSMVFAIEPAPHININNFDGFHSANLNYTLIKKHEIPNYEEMFAEMDLHQMMGRPGFDAKSLATMFEVIADKIADTPNPEAVKAKNILLALTITLRNDTKKLKAGDFVGSMSLQKRPLQEENDALKDFASRYALFNLGIASRQAAHGQGFGKEACNAVADRFFQTTKDFPSALIWSTTRNNVASIKVGLACGFRKLSETKNSNGISDFDHLHFVREPNAGIMRE